MKTYDLYGSDVQDIELARQIIADAVLVKLIAHESSYHCGDYYRSGDIGSEHFMLQRNFDEHENEWTEQDFKTFPLLLYINETIRSEYFENKLVLDKRFKLLRREQL
jgi:hypothetical protein